MNMFFTHTRPGRCYYRPTAPQQVGTFPSDTHKSPHPPPSLPSQVVRTCAPWRWVRAAAGTAWTALLTAAPRR